MRHAWIFARRLVEWLALFALGHGIILFLGTIEIFPDRVVASVITTMTNAPTWAHWLMAGAFGLLGTFLLERFFWRSSLAPRLLRGQKNATDPVASDTQRYLNAYEVIHYLADDSKWGNEVRHGPSVQIGTTNVRKMPLLEAPVEFKRIAEQGGIHAIGRLDGVGQHVQIPETYWMAATLSPFSLDNQEFSETLPAVPNPNGIPVYKNVRILQSDVERVWPRLLRRGPRAESDHPVSS
jgi:hypothetical protein